MEVCLVLVATSFLAVNSAPLDISSCDDGWILDNGNCYFISGQSVTSWNEAAQQCLGKSGDLFAYSDDDVDAATLLLTSVPDGPQRYWINGISSSDDGSSANQIDNIDKTYTCSYLQLAPSQSSMKQMISCDTPDYGYICQKGPNIPSTFIPAISSTVPPQSADSPTTAPITQPVTAEDDQKDEDDNDDENEPLAAVAEPFCRDNWGLSPSGTRCYFISDTFVSGSFFESQQFCAGLGGRLLQPTTLEEFNNVDQMIKSTSTWTFGPWIGLIRPFHDDTVVFSSTGEAPGDPDLEGLLAEYVDVNDTKASCGGYGPGPNTSFAFYDCAQMGNPFCEAAPMFAIFPVNVSLLGDTISSNVSM